MLLVDLIVFILWLSCLVALIQKKLLLGVDKLALVLFTFFLTLLNVNNVLTLLKVEADLLYTIVLISAGLFLLASGIMTVKNRHTTRQ
jgi:hypothetical protein